MSIFDRFREISKSESVPTGPVEYLIVGLGNPGEQYAYTRHNAGFMVIDAMAERLETDVKRFKFKSLCSDVTISGKHCILMKPETYMNNSGQAVSEAMAFYKLDIEHVIIVYDDISLEPGTLRIRRKGNAGETREERNRSQISKKNDQNRKKEKRHGKKNEFRQSRFLVRSHKILRN